MPRYSKLSNDEEEDDDTVALMLGQAPPRLARFGATEYVRLENLNEDGTAENSRPAKEKTVHDRFKKSQKQSSRNLVAVILGAAFTIVAGAVLVSLYRRSHEPATTPVMGPVLRHPLDPMTAFSNGTHEFKRLTLMISLDGMHPHDLSPERTPRLDKLAKHGFSTPYIVPSFPTQTFPNHWTLVTGMYPLNHGIVGNTFYDPTLDLEFVNTDPEKSLDRRFWGGEPLWVTANRYGLRSAVHMWPGSEADWGSDGPTEVDKFNKHEPLERKADAILSWLDRAEPPELMLAYVPNVDTVGHETGIASRELREECLHVDHFIERILDGVAERNLTHIVNVVVVSDHGMAPTSNSRLVFLDDVIDNYANATSNRGWPLAGLRFNTSEEVEQALQSAMYEQREYSGDLLAYTAYKSEEMPEHWHFRKTAEADNTAEEPHRSKYEDRLASMYVVPQTGFSLLTHKEWDEMNHNYFLKGVHGYDNHAPLMRALFLAQGPAFPPGKYDPFPNIDVYSAICRSLGIPESKDSDGDFRVYRTEGKFGIENYPGVEFDTPIFEGSSFKDFYNGK